MANVCLALWKSRMESEAKKRKELQTKKKTKERERHKIVQMWEEVGGRRKKSA
jgi:hypothetical protein